MPIGSYGSDDTINLPAGTITLTNDLPSISESISIQGQGMGQSVIDGDQSYRLFRRNSAEGSFTLQGVTLQSFTQFAVYTTGGDVSLSNIEMDGTNSDPGDSVIAIRQGSGTHDVNATNIYIHDASVPNDGEGIFRIVNGDGSEASGEMNVNLQNITMANLSSDNEFIGAGLTIRSGNANSTNSIITNAHLGNITIDGFTTGSESLTASMLTITAMTDSGVSDITADVSNVTLQGLSAGSGMFGPGGVFATAGWAVGEGGVSTVNVDIKNALFANNNLLPSGHSSCLAANINDLFGGAGTVSTSLTSNGGNISDDSSCNDYFIDSTDQTEVDPADLHLGTLGDYGGSVPTIPLESGSIAIDSGVDVEDLTTDARGVTRPQCSAYDSGAYEYDGTCPTPSSNVLTTPSLTPPLPTSFSQKVYLTLLSLPQTLLAFLLTQATTSQPV